MAEIIRSATDRARRDLSGKAPWRAFEEYDLANERPTYADVAVKLGIKESDVRNHLFLVRTKMREYIREELRDTVSTEEEAREEWNALFGD